MRGSMNRVVLAGMAWMGGIACGSAADVPISIQGVIVEDLTGLCSTFEADDGVTYILSTLGAFTPGDRVHVEGSYNEDIAGVCFNTAGFLIEVERLRPAFAGVGTISMVGDRVFLVTSDGRSYRLQNPGGHRPGTLVYAQGTVVATRNMLVLDNSVIGRGFSGFGRITSLTPGDVRMVTETGESYLLDRPGSIAGAVVGDLIFVEGIRGRPDGGGPIPLGSVTARPAFEASGRVVASNGGLAFDPETLINFGQTYTADAVYAFAEGDKVYLRGRRADDYDYGEAKPVRDVRESQADLAFSGVGVLDRASGTVMLTSEDTAVSIARMGDPAWFPTGTLVYIAGSIGAQGPGSITLTQNQIRFGLDGVGRLVLGFGCSPIIAFDGGGYIFPRNNGGLPLNTLVRVTGGITLEDPCMDTDALVDNTIAVALCPNCE